jgi:hypothetical protein
MTLSSTPLKEKAGTHSGFGRHIAPRICCLLRQDMMALPLPSSVTLTKGAPRAATCLLRVIGKPHLWLMTVHVLISRRTNLFPLLRKVPQRPSCPTGFWFVLLFLGPVMLVWFNNSSFPTQSSILASGLSSYNVTEKLFFFNNVTWKNVSTRSHIQLSKQSVTHPDPFT